MAQFLFIVGRPGSGKSTLARAIEDEFGQDRELLVINDYPILWEMFEEDCRKGPSEPRQFGERWQGGVRGFDILDRRPVFNTALYRMSEFLRPYLETDRLILVEFSRNDYSDVRSSFSPVIMSNARCLFLATPLEICIQRIRRRVMDQRYIDDNLVSEETMRRNHQDDGRASLFAQFTREHVRVVHNGGAWDETWRQASRFLDDLLPQPVVADRWPQTRLQLVGPSFVRRQWTFLPL